MSVERSLGQRRVGVDFNPSGSTTINSVKRRAADIIDRLNALPNRDAETRRTVEKAMDEIEGAAMWAVKAVAMAERAATAPDSA
ncbi:MAG: hypothetical protein OXI03_09205 [Chloroflexota bacterium]|nr:hypothetical protein [Chloroflexota bacterium]